MAKKVDKIKCICCGAEKTGTRDYYSSSSEWYEDIGRIPICKSHIEDKYNDILRRYDGDIKLAAKRLFVMLDVYFDEELYNSCVTKSIQDDVKWLGEYMRIVNSNKKYKDKSSIDNINPNEVEEEVVKDNDSSFKVSNKSAKKWGRGFDELDYQFLDDKYKEFTSAYECRTPAQRTIFEQICKCLLRSEKAFMEGDDNRFEKLNNSISKLMTDGNIKPIQEAGVSDDDALILGKWINRIEQERPIGEACDQFKDVDGIMKYITKWFTKQMYRVFDVDSGGETDVDEN